MDPLHVRQVDRQTAIGQGPAGHAVATAPYRQLQTFVTRGRDSRHDIGDALTLRDQRGALGDQCVVDLAGAVVVGVIWG